MLFGCGDVFKELDPQQPGCLLLDIQMPEMDGLEVQRKLEKLGNGLTIIFMSNYGTLDTAVKAFRGGAFDFFKKPIVPDELFAAIERGVCKDRARLEAKFESSPAGKLEKLTDRERQVAGDLAQGLPSSLISEHLGISERTLERHRQNILKNLMPLLFRSSEKSTAESKNNLNQSQMNTRIRELTSRIRDTRKN